MATALITAARAGIPVDRAELLRDRTNAGLAAARARKGGRRPKLTPGKLATARQLYDTGTHTVAQIAEIVGVARSTLYRALDPTREGKSMTSNDAAVTASQVIA